MRALVVMAVFCLLLAGPVAAQTVEKRQMAGRPVMIWLPKSSLRAPVVIFSHGWRGVNHQSAPLMRALARAGYVVVAPNHKDALFGTGIPPDPQVSFDEPTMWTADTYRDRAEDLASVWAALKSEYKNRVDPERLVLMGHSLGGYTAMGLSGAVPAWDSYGFKPRAVVCFSPFTTPYLAHGSLALRAPVMYQGGSEDDFITPPVARPDGTYARSSKPKVFVEFEGAVHTSWSVLDPDYEEPIEAYTLAFLDHFVKGKPLAPILRQRPAGVSDLRLEE
ncbi:MAG: alpha/beta fold hydrolase [Candidatus Eremiobacteraeota bacterium]|nr:alpha/beta fold hydrolase [Candidatus Eremiobacteraeota bacterium]MCW5871343.1 alpha/beta fold hydrolase [Candidatus Eremiobacteraeota bacterium]